MELDTPNLGRVRIYVEFFTRPPLDIVSYYSQLGPWDDFIFYLTGYQLGRTKVYFLTSSRLDIAVERALTIVASYGGDMEPHCTSHGASGSTCFAIIGLRVHTLLIITAFESWPWLLLRSLRCTCWHIVRSEMHNAMGYGKYSKR
jgi:hypothetical protein